MILRYFYLLIPSGRLVFEDQKLIGRPFTLQPVGNRNVLLKVWQQAGTLSGNSQTLPGTHPCSCHVILNLSGKESMALQSFLQCPTL